MAIVSFSSSASLSELEIDEDAGEIALTFALVMGCMDFDGLLASWSVSLSSLSLLPSLLLPLLVSLSSLSSLWLLLVVSVALVLTSTTFGLVFTIFTRLVDLSGLLSLLSTLRSCRPSHSLNHSLYIFTRSGTPSSILVAISTSHP